MVLLQTRFGIDDLILGDDADALRRSAARATARLDG